MESARLARRKRLQGGNGRGEGMAAREAERLVSERVNLNSESVTV